MCLLNALPSYFISPSFLRLQFFSFSSSSSASPPQSVYHSHLSSRVPPCCPAPLVPCCSRHCTAIAPKLSHRRIYVCRSQPAPVCWRLPLCTQLVVLFPAGLGVRTKGPSDTWPHVSRDCLLCSLSAIRLRQQTSLRGLLFSLPPACPLLATMSTMASLASPSLTSPAVSCRCPWLPCPPPLGERSFLEKESP